MKYNFHHKIVFRGIAPWKKLRNMPGENKRIAYKKNGEAA
jgi:hypothetical protein